MSDASNLPAPILEAVNLIRELRGKQRLTRQEQESLNRAKLRIAYWACRSEQVVTSRENLTYILGPDATDIMKAYDKYLVKEGEDKEGKRTGGDGLDDSGKFWGGIR